MHRRRGKQHPPRWTGNVQIRKAPVSHPSPCTLCKYVAPRSYDRGVIEPLTTTVEDVRQLSSVGCPICAMICKVVGSRIPGTRDVTLYIWQNGRLHIVPWVNSSGLAFYNSAVEIYTNAGEPSPWPSVSPLAHGLRGAEAASSPIRNWIERCVAEHSGCKTSDVLPPLPTRVLEILGPNEVRLCSSSKTDRAWYACLSHCWGDLDLIRTTRPTYNSNLEGIPWDSLPLTYQHAISICHSLGLRYLWIDSLCIIQDDVEDWRHEGSKMASIYADSYITIAALASKNACQGLYRPGATIPVLQHEMISGTTGLSYKIYGHHPQEHALLADVPLIYRAWFFQERMLSPRVVFFTKHELIWECFDTVTCECTYDHKKYGGPLGRPYRLSVVRDREYDAGMWHNCVTAYNAQDLTFESDTLPAIQGLAKTMQSSLGQYYAGLWSNILFQDIAWYSESKNLRRKEYVAPSWSWASVKGRVKWFNFVTSAEQLANIVSISTTPVGDPMGEVTEGLLVLRGRCVAATLTYTGIDSQSRPGTTVRFDLGSAEVAEVPQLHFGEWYPDSFENIQADVPLVLMQMALLQGDITLFTFLIGFKKGSEIDGRYERVGCARTTSTEVVKAFRDFGEEVEIAVV